MSIHILGIDVGIRNLCLCHLLYDNKTYTIRQWTNIDVLELLPHRKHIKHIHCSDLPMIMLLLQKRIQLFDMDYVKCNIHHIVIELQPFSKRGTSLKINLFAHYLYNYFTQLRLQVVFGQHLSSIRFLHGKCKYIQSWLIKCNESKPDTYKTRKALSIRLCEKLMSIHNITYNSGYGIPSVDKRDDYADSFLLALYAIEQELHFIKAFHPHMD